MLLSALLRRYQLKVAIAVQAAIFASLHFEADEGLPFLWVRSNRGLDLSSCHTFSLDLANPRSSSLVG